MILVAWGASVFDCYIQRVLIQIRLLKLIEVNKVLMFDGSALNGIVDKVGCLKDKNEHFGL